MQPITIGHNFFKTNIKLLQCLYGKQQHQQYRQTWYLYQKVTYNTFHMRVGKQVFFEEKNLILKLSRMP